MCVWMCSAMWLFGWVCGVIFNGAFVVSNENFSHKMCNFDWKMCLKSVFLLDGIKILD